jgi:hypothetical protein
VVVDSIARDRRVVVDSIARDRRVVVDSIARDRRVVVDSIAKALANSGPKQQQKKKWVLWPS